MKRFFLYLTALMILSLPVSSALALTKIMIIGDSLSAGYGLKQAQSWVKLLQNKYDETDKPIELFNMSVSGQTTDNALLKIAKQLEVNTPTHVLIELGGNDGLRGFPVKRIKENLMELVSQSRTAGAKVAIMQVAIPPNLGPRYTEMFSNTFANVAEKTSSFKMPFFMNQIADKPALMQNDNLHPNDEAQPLIRDIMEKQIDEWLTASQ
ncbi:arylesterase (plasmid) [Pseudoalteromonas xiamenensis]|uniref:arylesterase n=1 Tax=Pseudoalteromonas xiamenensis TaxID=882626 RepID=UPI0027E50B09|nr:arylesterase [Pseudoalteromonas xiamenensis]WMN61877.1 arylesterase [Pseudoalteromonas xiamenensis]